MSDYLEMKKACTDWVSKLLSPLQRANRVDCHEEFLENCSQGPIGSFGRIVTKDEIWVHHYDLLNQQEAKTWKQSGEKTPSPPRVTRSADKIIMIIFQDCEGVLLVDFLPCSIATNGPYYGSFFHRSRSSTRKKHHGKLRCRWYVASSRQRTCSQVQHRTGCYPVHKLHRIQSFYIFSRYCNQRLLSVLKSEDFSSW